MAHILLALAVASALGGCAHTTNVGSRRRVHITLSEYRITPSTVRAYAGTLTITVRNIGTRTHNLVVSQGTVATAQTPDLMPGATVTITVDLAPGRYMMRSSILSDQALGEWGTLDVVRVSRRRR
jgi:hypothetical protein